MWTVVPQVEWTLEVVDILGCGFQSSTRGEFRTCIAGLCDIVDTYGSHDDQLSLARRGLQEAETSGEVYIRSGTEQPH